MAMGVSWRGKAPRPGKWQATMAAEDAFTFCFADCREEDAVVGDEKTIRWVTCCQSRVNHFV